MVGLRCSLGRPCKAVFQCLYNAPPFSAPPKANHSITAPALVHRMLAAVQRGGRAQAAHGRADMGVGDGQPQAVGRIGAGQRRQGQQTAHPLPLLAARPWPTTAFFICSAVYSATGKWLATKAVIQAPRAWPSSRVDCGLTLTNTISTAAASGW